MREAKPGVYEYQLEAEVPLPLRESGGMSILCVYLYLCLRSEQCCPPLRPCWCPERPEIETATWLSLDMGAEYHCYCSDLTCTMPVGVNLDRLKELCMKAS